MKIAFNLIDIDLPHFAENHIFFHNISDLHCATEIITGGIKGDSDIICSVQFFANDARTQSLPVQADH